MTYFLFFFFFQAEDGIRDRSPSRGLGDVYKRQDFMKSENYLKNAEMAMEDDYGMIDGIINNGKAPGLEERPSVLEQLKEKPVPDVSHKPPKSHPEREIEWWISHKMSGTWWCFTALAQGQGCVCLLYTSDAADEEDSVDLGGRGIIKKKKGEK